MDITKFIWRTEMTNPVISIIHSKFLTTQLLKGVLHLLPQN